MRSLKQTITILALTFGLIASAQAGDSDKKLAEAPAELKNQTHCPVMGGKIDSAVFTDIQGQRVYHCCPMCSDKLKENPDKYFKKAAEEGVLFQNIQATCPVSGKEISEKTVFTDYEGRRVYFCCEGCPETFNEEPAQYLKKLDGTSGPGETENTKKMDHGDHSGHSH